MPTLAQVTGKPSERPANGITPSCEYCLLWQKHTHRQAAHCQALTLELQAARTQIQTLLLMLQQNLAQNGIDGGDPFSNPPAGVDPQQALIEQAQKLGYDVSGLLPAPAEAAPPPPPKSLGGNYTVDKENLPDWSAADPTTMKPLNNPTQGFFTRAPEENPFYKTQPCKRWDTEGTCAFGDKCNFAHGIEELREKPPSWVAASVFGARDAARGEVLLPEKAKSSAPDPYGAPVGGIGPALPPEPGTEPAQEPVKRPRLDPGRRPDDPHLFKKMSICKQWETSGSCPFGNHCAFAHGEHELIEST